MKAAILSKLHQFRYKEVPDPVLSTPHDVLLRMRTVGVCGSDIHYYTTGRIGSQVVQYPFTVGHEGAAVVEAVGQAVTRVKPGDRVAIEPAISCGNCDQCRAGRAHTCRRLKFLGCPGQLEGCLSQLLVMPEACCFPIPENLTFDDAVLCEPLSIGMYAVRQSRPLREATIGILGLGPIGLSVLVSARASQPKAVYATDPLPYRRAMAEAQGVAWTADPATPDLVNQVLVQEPEGLDVVFECCGKQEAFDQAIQLLKPGGKLMLIGIPEFDRYSFPADSARRKELCLQQVRRQNHCVQPAIDAVAAGTIRPQFMVTHRFNLKNCAKAFDLVAGYADGVIKAMIEIDP